MEHLGFPNESAEYRAARNALLEAEMALRRQTEEVAALRRALPPGGLLKEDYLFRRVGAYQREEEVRLSELFEGKPSLILYSYMFGPERDEPCVGCTHLLDGLDGAARHVSQVVPFYVVARSPLSRLVGWARERRWPHLRFLSAEGNTYTSDYFGNTAGVTTAMREERGYEPGKDWDEPMINVFRRDGDGVRHFWGGELVYAPEEPGEHHRALDVLDPVWGMLDLLPEGRGEFFPKLSYR
ncbi:MAG: DUF899 domain-containing protein [Novosphingobium pentaromativorans]|uniref:DUF899 domain-containing protein n=1 Tax=Novosphingobium pentaromativorans TaxID=205844 RepID=A0A2W5NV88_9SPHN|nr:MAG: DUF899 domain-containing protein [Novosphingobium pentaromativorans]